MVNERIYFLRELKIWRNYLLYHFLESLDVINLSFRVVLDDVADVREPVRVEELPSLVFPIEITFHHQRFPDANRTGFAGSDKFSGILRRYDLEKTYFLMISGIFVRKKITKTSIKNLFTSILKAPKNLIISPKIPFFYRGWVISLYPPRGLC